jgi:hypothetical protein
MDKNKAITGGDDQGGAEHVPPTGPHQRIQFTNAEGFRCLDCGAVNFQSACDLGPTCTSIDVAKDAGLMNRLRERHPRWRIPLALKDKMVGAIDWALDQAQADGDAKTVAGLVKTAAVLEGQNQADEHLAEKNKRLDDGLPTDNVTIRVPPPRTFKESQG